ncbi:hypothetical protein [Chryseobacterium sp. SIMBA_029]|uniref:hypothetical protein n=1 Tax=Chryseobacterium sp. SIMBA_029 TaxID=3085772 RepID=UPI0039782E5D
MKTLNVSQMEIINGSFDCSNENRLAFVAGAAIGGAIFMGWGGLVTGYAARVYTVIKCDD